MGIASLFFEHLSGESAAVIISVNIIDFSIVFISVFEVLYEIKQSSYKIIYFKRNLISLIFLAVYLIFFSFSKVFLFLDMANLFKGYTSIIIIRNLFIFLKIFSRFQKLSDFLQNIINHPSQTIVFSFLILIAVGAVLLSMPFSSSSGKSLKFIDCFFTSTSAVCVTGLAVLDTSGGFSFWGKLIIMILIQSGGLGIMILSFAALFFLNRGISLENKLMLSYMINEDAITNVASAVKRIVGLTFIIEAAGVALLFVFLPGAGLNLSDRIFYSLFHAVSAFCNAGFALYSDSLVSFSGNPGVLLTIAFLIIAGGLGFSVLYDIYENGKKALFRKREKARFKMKINTKVVLKMTFFLLLTGTFLIYYFEHSRTMKDLPVLHQYINAFFQSVTLRTAGFNSTDFSSLAPPVMIIMIIYMFVGGATGSTAGGVKVNNVAVAVLYFKAFFVKKKDITLYDYRISQDSVLKSLTVILIGIFLVTAGFLLLSVTESFSVRDILFETVSAFGTVGLSTGITPLLSSAGKVVVIILMFLGRLGPLTVAASLSRSRSVKINISYPEADISIG